MCPYIVHHSPKNHSTYDGLITDEMRFGVVACDGDEGALVAHRVAIRSESRTIAIAELQTDRSSHSVE